MYGNKMMYKDYNPHDKVAQHPFFQRWRIQFLLPIPFMLLALLIFSTCARKETIEYYVKKNRKKEAIELMKQVIVGKEDEYYEKKYNEKKEQGVLYTNLIPSKRQQERDKKKLEKKIKKGAKCIGAMSKVLSKVTGEKPESDSDDKDDKKDKKKKKDQKDKTDKGKSKSADEMEEVEMAEKKGDEVVVDDLGVSKSSIAASEKSSTAMLKGNKVGILPADEAMSRTGDQKGLGDKYTPNDTDPGINNLL